MNLSVSPADEEFRQEVRQWLAKHKPRERRPRDGKSMGEFDLAWQRAQFEGGWAGPTWPAEAGGLGLSLLRQMIWFEEYAQADGPEPGLSATGINHAGPTLIARGSQAQKDRHLSRILRGDVAWSQAFSEPGAGSDLAGIATTARIEGTDLVVSGAKTWSSYAELSDYQELLVRTSRGPRRQDGITWVICDTRSPGITIRPIETMVGLTQFCEVFYDEVRIPAANVVGGVGEGWSVAMSTLSFERGTAFVQQQVRLTSELDRLVELARDTADARGRSRLGDETVRARLAMARAEGQALRAMTLAVISRNARREQPGADASMVRYYYSTLHKRYTRLALDIAGVDGLEMATREQPDNYATAYLKSYSGTIAAGTMDIQLNIIGERLLGLPRGR